MSWKKGALLYEGKAKKVYAVSSDDDHLWIEYKNSLTAFNAQKKGSFDKKGYVNLQITSKIFKFLQQNKVRTHFVENVSQSEMICQKLKMIPLEVVVRNQVAGSYAKKFNLPEGGPIQPALVEFYYKNDELADPFISDDQALFLKTVESQRVLDNLKAEAKRINECLLTFFSQCQIRLIDFKIEFGLSRDGGLVLGDEISPDSCRLWDSETNEKLDKDRFRRDMGKVEESYLEVLHRIENAWKGF